MLQTRVMDAGLPKKKYLRKFNIGPLFISMAATDHSKFNYIVLEKLMKGAQTPILGPTIIP